MKYMILITTLLSSQVFAFNSKEIKICAEVAHARAKNIVNATVGSVVDFEEPNGTLQYTVKGNELLVTSVFNHYNTVSSVYTVDSTVLLDDKVDGPGLNCFMIQANYKTQYIE